MSVMSISTDGVPRRSSMRHPGLGRPQEVAADRRRHAHARPASGRRARWPGTRGCACPSRSVSRAFLQARHQRAGRERHVLLRILLGLVAQPQLDGIHVELVGELVHRLLERQHGRSPRPARASNRPPAGRAARCAGWSAGWARHRATRVAGRGGLGELVQARATATATRGRWR